MLRLLQWGSGTQFDETKLGVAKLQVHRMRSYSSPPQKINVLTQLPEIPLPKTIAEQTSIDIIQLIRFIQMIPIRKASPTVARSFY